MSNRTTFAQPFTFEDAKEIVGQPVVASQSMDGAPPHIVLKRGDELYAERRFGVRTTDRVVIALLAAEEAARVLGMARRPSVDAQPETDRTEAQAVVREMFEASVAALNGEAA